MTAEHPAPTDPDLHARPVQPEPPSRPAAGPPPWRRLAPGMLLVEPVREVIKFIPMLIVLIFAGRAGESGPPWGLIATGGGDRAGHQPVGDHPLPDHPVGGGGPPWCVPAQAPDGSAGSHPHRRRQRPPVAATAEAGEGADRHRDVPPRVRGPGARRAAGRHRGPLRAELLHGHRRPVLPARADARNGADAAPVPDRDRFRGHRPRRGDGARPAGPSVDRLCPGDAVRGHHGRGADQPGWRITSEARIRPTEIGVVAGRCGPCGARRCGWTRCWWPPPSS